MFGTASVITTTTNANAKHSNRNVPLRKNDSTLINNNNINMHNQSSTSRFRESSNNLRMPELASNNSNNNQY